jgi:hypothetical protein
MALDAHNVALTRQHHRRLALPKLQGFGNFGCGHNSGCAVTQGGNHCARGPKDVKYDTHGLAQVPPPQEGEFGGSKESFNCRRHHLIQKLPVCTPTVYEETRCQPMLINIG